MIVRVPASTANLGPGFDALGMALDLYADVGIVDASTSPEDAAKQVDEHHPASIAFGAAGGAGSLWVRSPIPIGRGLGFSGAMRVAGAAAAVAQHVGGDAASFAARRSDVLSIAAELEGHADNAAASLYGGVVATNGVCAVRVDTPLRPDVVLWIPETTTSTATSRSALPASVALVDAVFNIAHTAVLVAALATGDVAALQIATQDRLHQERRLEGAHQARLAMEAGVAAGAWCAWLSGSGPTIALFAAPGEGTRVARQLPAGGHVKVTSIDREGTVIV